MGVTGGLKLRIKLAIAAWLIAAIVGALAVRNLMLSGVEGPAYNFGAPATSLLTPVFFLLPVVTRRAEKFKVATNNGRHDWRCELGRLAVRVHS